MLRILFHILFCFVTIPVMAQEQFIEKPAQLLTRFRFTQLTGGVMLIKARL
jgi:hypothetical protein